MTYESVLILTILHHIVYCADPLLVSGPFAVPNFKTELKLFLGSYKDAKITVLQCHFLIFHCLNHDANRRSLVHIKNRVIQFLPDFDHIPLINKRHLEGKFEDSSLPESFAPTCEIS